MSLGNDGISMQSGSDYLCWGNTHGSWTSVSPEWSIIWIYFPTTYPSGVFTRDLSVGKMDILMGNLNLRQHQARTWLDVSWVSECRKVFITKPVGIREHGPWLRTKTLMSDRWYFKSRLLDVRTLAYYLTSLSLDVLANDDYTLSEE